MIDKQRFNQLTSTLDAYLDQDVYPGVSFSLVTKAESKRYINGYRSLIPNKIKNDESTIYDLASLTKVACTTFCILKLMEEGKLSLNTKVCDILTNFKNKEVKIINLLNHTSGFPAGIDNYKVLSKKDYLAKVMNIEPVCKSNTKVLYSDINFILLGLIVAKVSNTSLSAYANEILFQPLDMKNTGFLLERDINLFAAYEDKPNRGIVRGAVHDGQAYKLGGISGNAGLFSTLEDLEKFVKMLLNHGYYNGKRLFYSESMDLLKKCTTCGLNEKRSLGFVISDANYALGDYYSDHTLFHTGFTGGSILIDLDKNLAAITLCNRIHPSRENRKILTLRNNIHNLAYLCVEEERC